MKYLYIVLVMFSLNVTRAQGFECDGSFYLVIFTQSEGVSRLYRINENARQFVYEEIELSENRRLTSLSYNVLDKKLYALDVDTYEFIQIEKGGQINSLGIPDNLDQNYIYHSATISPDGAGIYILGHDPEFGFDTRFYTINLSRSGFYSGYLGVTGNHTVKVPDFATDPITGAMYGYDNLEGSLVQIGIGGQVSSLNYPATGEKNMDAVFFNRSGEMFSYSAAKGMFFVNKGNGELQFLEKGPEGTSADGCSCPYTFEFTKDVQPRTIVECSEFDITYTFNNQMGIGQTWLDFRDTLPAGFEILSITSDVISPFNIIPSPTNVVALENFIYLMGKNEINVRVKAPFDYYGSFSSQAVQWDFPIAFDTTQYSDDPLTSLQNDQTTAQIVGPEEISFDAKIDYSCDGTFATLHAPFEAEKFEWSDGSSEPSIVVSKPGIYSLRAENECVIFYDSIQISEFPEPKSVVIEGTDEVVIGNMASLIAISNMSGNLNYSWMLEDTTITCNCPSIEFVPKNSMEVRLSVTDSRRCLAKTSHQITTIELRNIYAPTAFTPNSDLINDHFFFHSSSPGHVKIFQVFNRWGGELFRAENIPMNEEEYGWDGKLNNKVLPSGLYIWTAVIEYFDGFSETRHGEIVLIGK